MISPKPQEMKVVEMSNNSVLKHKATSAFLNADHEWQTNLLSFLRLHKKSWVERPPKSQGSKQKIKHTIKNFILALLPLDVLTDSFLPPLSRGISNSQNIFLEGQSVWANLHVFIMVVCLIISTKLEFSANPPSTHFCSS